MPKFQKKVYCTLDTETAGGLDNPLLFHIAGIIHDRQGRQIATFNYLAADRIEEARQSEFFKDKFYLYDEMIANGTGSLVANANIAVWNTLEMLKYFKVDTLCAYNSHFDLCRTEARRLLEKGDFEFIDIWLACLETLANRQDFQSFARKHNLITQSGKYLSTSAETVYGFLTNNPNYQEQHTAFEDSLIEKTILETIWNTHKRFTRNTHFNNMKRKFSLLPLVKEIPEITC